MNAKAGSRFNDGQLFSDLEHLSAEEMRSLHLGKLRKQMDYVCSRSDFYKDKFRSTGFRPEHLKSLEDLAALPFTEKDELRASLDAHPPLGRHLCAAPEEVVQLQASSGTTGKPSYIAYSAKDLRMVCDMTARCFFAAGLRKGDKVLHSFAMSRGFVGGLPMAQSLHHLGATVLPIGAEAGVERLLRVIEDQSARRASSAISPHRQRACSDDRQPSWESATLLSAASRAADCPRRAPASSGCGARPCARCTACPTSATVSGVRVSMRRACTSWGRATCMRS
jgi:hypothetical protein